MKDRRHGVGKGPRAAPLAWTYTCFPALAPTCACNTNQTHAGFATKLLITGATGSIGSHLAGAGVSGSPRGCRRADEHPLEQQRSRRSSSGTPALVGELQDIEFARKAVKVGDADSTWRPHRVRPALQTIILPRQRGCHPGAARCLRGPRRDVSFRGASSASTVSPPPRHWTQSALQPSNIYETTSSPPKRSPRVMRAGSKRPSSASPRLTVRRRSGRSSSSGRRARGRPALIGAGCRTCASRSTSWTWLRIAVRRSTSGRHRPDLHLRRTQRHHDTRDYAHRRSTRA